MCCSAGQNITYYSNKHLTLFERAAWADKGFFSAVF